MRTEVVNLRTNTYDQYIGRGSKFGNPYRIGKDGTRKEVISKYRTDFEDLVTNDSEFRDAVCELAGLRLGCYCKPKDCHGDIIVEWLIKEGYSE